MTGRFACRCPTPSVHPSPLRPDTCVQCSGVLSPKWTSNDVTQGRFWDRLEDGLFPHGVAPSWFDNLRRLALIREHEGRDLYGLRFFGRDSLADANEEIADFVTYIVLDSLKTIRAEGSDEDIDTALTAAAHAARAYEAAQHLKAKRRGAP